MRSVLRQAQHERRGAQHERVSVFYRGRRPLLQGGLFFVGAATGRDGVGWSEQLLDFEVCLNGLERVDDVLGF